MEILSQIFQCQIDQMPFTYLELPPGRSKPLVLDCMPIAHRADKRLLCCADFLTQADKLEMVNSVLSSVRTFDMHTIKVPIAIQELIDKYRKHLLWRGSDINAKKPSLTAWDTVTRPKSQGGLRLIKRVQNDALLLKNMHKFLNKEDLLWVHLLWNNYYQNGKLPPQRKKGSFWWRDIVKLLNQLKAIETFQAEEDSTVLYSRTYGEAQFLCINSHKFFHIQKIRT